MKRDIRMDERLWEHRSVGRMCTVHGRTHGATNTDM